jgi:hypothetical protein
VLGSCFEVLVHVYILAFGMAYFFEPIHVELSYERSEIFMFEVVGQDFFCELGDIFN